jgi:hypothetical protein
VLKIRITKRCTAKWIIEMILINLLELDISVRRATKTWVCGRSPAGIAGSNSAEGMDVCFECCVCCQVEVSATGRSFVQRSPTYCGVSLCVIK